MLIVALGEEVKSLSQQLTTIKAKKLADDLSTLNSKEEKTKLFIRTIVELVFFFYIVSELVFMNIFEFELFLFVLQRKNMWSSSTKIRRNFVYFNFVCICFKLRSL